MNKDLIKKEYYVKKYYYILAIINIILCIIDIIRGLQFKNYSMFDYFEVFTRISFSLVLVYGVHKNKSSIIQAGCCGLIVSITYYKAYYVLEKLFSYNIEVFIKIGFWGSFYLATELLVLILMIFLLINHYTLFILKKNNLIRLKLNKNLIFILLFFLVFDELITFNLKGDIAIVVNAIVYDMSLILQYLMIVFSEGLLWINNEKRENDDE